MPTPSSYLYRSAPLALLLVLVLLVGTSTVAAVEPSTPGQGSLQAKGSDGTLLIMPLRETNVRVEISSFVARVVVEQVFSNPFEEAIEAIYVFPLPERAAVDDFIMEAGERRIRGEVQRREEAERIYQAARSAGYTAAVLHQERPNVFTQSVANIPPGEDVTIRIGYVDMLVYEDGDYRFLFPMVVAPRYNPSAGGELAITVPVLRPGFRSGHDISLTVAIDAGLPIHSLGSDSHDIEVVFDTPNRARAWIARHDRLPNKDFMLRWKVAGEEPEIGVLAHRVDDDGFFALLIQPKATISAQEAAPKEIIFVLDDSGSMEGLPIEMSQRFMRLALESMGPQDRFNIVRFAGIAEVMAPEPLDNTPSNLRLGLKAVKKLSGSGGTEMLSGFRAAMAQPRDERCVRILFFLTDGHIGDDNQILEVVNRSRGDARVFTLGIGSSVNHYLLREMADLGRGAYMHVRPDGNEKEAVARFHDWVTKPYLTDLEIDWGALRVEDVQPARLPDLYSGQTLSVVGRYLWGGEETLVLRGRIGGVLWEKQVEVKLPERSERHAALASVWARERIRELTLTPTSSPRSVKAQVTSLALGYRLMSPFTSFVAVDESRVVNPAGPPIPIVQALEIPDMVSLEGCFGPEGPSREGPTPGADPVKIAGGVARGFQAPMPTAPLAVATGASSSTIQGRVMNTDNVGLAGVVITIISPVEASGSRQVTTDLDGNYLFTDLPAAGDYSLRVDQPGFASMEVGPLDTDSGRTTRADLTLRSHAETTETIVVQSHGNIVETSSTKTSTTYKAEFLEGLPVLGSNYQDILTTAPGVTDTDGDGNPNVHGSRDKEVQSGVHGGNITGPHSGTFGQNLTPDIIEQLEAITSGASAPFGRAHGGFSGITNLEPRENASPPAGMVVLEPSLSSEDRDIVELSVRVLADLAVDGRLSKSEGLPALAGLLASQYSDGGFTRHAATQALATWALEEAARAMPGLPWVGPAAENSRAFLGSLELEGAEVSEETEALLESAGKMLGGSAMHVIAAIRTGFKAGRVAGPGKPEP